MRQIRTYRHKARTYHWCCLCTRQIAPGDIYAGNVMVINNKLFVHKEHVDPCCNPPEEEFLSSMNEKEGKEVLMEQQSQKVAA
ncbi:MAG: hypothetical protein WC603_02530 [Candidatus Paceibacterota bacterium]